MKAELSTKTIAIQGSGWGWLGFDKISGTYLLGIFIIQAVYILQGVQMKSKQP